MALEKGCLAEFKGKSLDNINIDPEGTKYFSDAVFKLFCVFMWVNMYNMSLITFYVIILFLTYSKPSQEMKAFFNVS